MPHQDRYHVQKKQPKNMKERVFFILGIPFLLPRWFISFLLARMMSNVLLSPVAMKEQRAVNLVHLSDDPDDKGCIILNLQRKPRLKTVHDYLLRFCTLFHLPSLLPKKNILHCNNPRDKAHVDAMLKHIGALLNGTSTQRHCNGKKFAQQDIHLKGIEFLDDDLHTYLLTQLKEQYHWDDSVSSEMKIDFYSLETQDGAVLDSVAVSCKGEDQKPMSERKFVIPCLVNRQNFTAWLKDFSYSAREIGCTVVGFNYRGIDYSQGLIWTEDNMVNDALAQMEYLLSLGAKPENIGFEGQCFGGAVATLAAAKAHERGIPVKLYNERSYRSIPRLLAGFWMPPLNSRWWNPVNWVRYVMAGVIYAISLPLVWAVGWHMDVASAWDKIPMANKNYSVIRNSVVGASREDGVIQDSWASVASLMDGKKQAIRERQNRNEVLTAEEWRILESGRHFKVSSRYQGSSRAMPHTLQRRHLVRSDSDSEGELRESMHDDMVKSFRAQFFSSTPNQTFMEPGTMTYQYNPHSHVKIWISKNPDLFMNFENQCRLIGMREQCPNDSFHLIYDSSMLNPVAQDELQKYCLENRITPVDAHLFDEAQLNSDDERALYKKYKDEVTHLDQGGNLAVCSDILRWLSPCYRLGTYLDLDVPLNTSQLPETMRVNSPLLLNIGSLSLFADQEVLIVNNDYIAIVDEAAAKPYIEKIHQALLNKLNDYSADFVDTTEKQLSQKGFLNRLAVKAFHARAEAEYIKKTQQLVLPVGVPHTSRNVRAYVQEVMTDKEKYLNFHRGQGNETDAELIKRLRAELRAQQGWIKWFFFNSEYNEIRHGLALDDDRFLQYMMKKERSLYLKSIVVCTTGPLEIESALFGYTLDKKDVARKVLPFAFRQYQLHQAFVSPNGIPLYENPIRMLSFLGADVGALNDSSWLEEGVSLQQQREEGLLAKKQELTNHLSDNLMKLKERIGRQISLLIEEDKGLFAFIGRASRVRKIEALRQIAQCFNEENNTLDSVRLKAILRDNSLNWKSVFSGFFSHRTKDLVNDLRQLCQDCILLRVICDKKEAVSYSKKSPFSPILDVKKRSREDSNNENERVQQEPVASGRRSDNTMFGSSCKKPKVSLSDEVADSSLSKKPS